MIFKKNVLWSSKACWPRARLCCYVDRPAVELPPSWLYYIPFPPAQQRGLRDILEPECPCPCLFSKEPSNFGSSSTLAWKIPWTKEPGRLQSMGSLRVGYDWVTSLSLFTFHALEKEMAPHSSVLAWRIPGTGEPGGLPSMGSHRVGHNWSDLAAAAAAVPWGEEEAEPCHCSKVIASLLKQTFVSQSV